jgi:hypothetical protein
MKVLVVLCTLLWTVSYTCQPMIVTNPENVQSVESTAKKTSENDKDQKRTAVYSETALTALIPGPGPVVNVIFQVLFVAAPATVELTLESANVPLAIEKWLDVLFSRISPAMAP